MSNLVNKPPDDKSSTSLTNGKLRSTTSSFKQRLNDVKQQREAVDPQTMPNRICLMLDCSGSMDNYESPDGSLATRSSSKRRIDLLKEAVQNFVSRCNFDDTSLAIATFPGRTDKTLPLTTQSSTIIGYCVGLDPSGGTPLHGCLVRTITEVAMTRGVVVSDGGATDWFDAAEDRIAIEDDENYDRGKIANNVLKLYKEQGIPLDCVHISSSTDGEALLRRIASETGGIFMKFSDVTAFSKAFGYLTPGYRAMLTSGSVSASELGAKEIK